MHLITENQVRETLTLPDAVSALRDAFLQFGRGRGRGVVLARSRAAMQDPTGAALMVSAMGAALPIISSAEGAVPGVLCTKVYGSLNEQFQFVITLFSSTTGLPLVTLMANELTRLRTAATTVVATDLLARPDAKVSGIFGASNQAQTGAQAPFAASPF